MGAVCEVGDAKHMVSVIFYVSCLVLSFVFVILVFL